jgi:hypothetical protein
MPPRSEVVRAETLATFVRLLGTYRRLHTNAVRWGQPVIATGVAEQIVLLEARIARLRHDAKRG